MRSRYITDVDNLYYYKETRWGKELDKKCFEALRAMEADGHIKISEILQLPIRKRSCSLPMLETLAQTLGWRGRIKILVKRIQTLCKRQYFSVRDQKLLRKLLSKHYSDCEINYDKLLYHFPGKTVDHLKSYIQENDL